MNTPLKRLSRAITPLHAGEEVAVASILEEYRTAVTLFPAFHSAHEGYAVLKEEVDELWDEVKKNVEARDNSKLRAEAKQVAAMALRFMVDVTNR